MFKAIEMNDFMLKSVNNKYKLVKGVFKLRDEYKNFKKALFYHVKRPPEILKPPYKVIIEKKTYLDIDNAVKPILDALKGRVITDDRDIEELHVYKEKRKKTYPSSLVVYVESIKTLN